MKICAYTVSRELEQLIQQYAAVTVLSKDAEEVKGATAFLNALIAEEQRFRKQRSARHEAVEAAPKYEGAFS